MSAVDPRGAVRSRPAAERLRTTDGSIAALEAFSRGDAFDRAWMGWGALRVLSRQDWEPGAMRDEGRVANMERFLLVLEGALDADCGVLGRHHAAAGEALWLECGHGVELRLANAARGAAMRLLDCWLQPHRVNARPSVSPCPAVRALHEPVADASAWHAPVPATPSSRILMADVVAGERLELPVRHPARCWLEVVEGELDFGAHGRLGAGDGLAWRQGASAALEAPTVVASGPARVLCFQLAD